MNTNLNRQIFETEDGSSSIYVPELDEHYHSTHGAIQESEYVYMNAGLKHIEKKEIAIFEVGFGTGLNAMLTMAANMTLNKTISFDTIERYPLTIDEVEKLNYTTFFDKEINPLLKQLHICSPNITTEITTNFHFTKIIQDLKTYTFTRSYDLILFDAFAPNKQADMWTADIFQKIFNATNKGGILVTYCAKGDVRRTLQSVGFTVERLPGPPHKLQMLRATKP